MLWTLQTGFGIEMIGWMRSYPGRTVTIYDVPFLVAEAQFHSLTIRNIQNCFRVSDIHPCNKNIFTDENFAPVKTLTAQIWELLILQVT